MSQNIFFIVAIVVIVGGVAWFAGRPDDRAVTTSPTPSEAAADVPFIDDSNSVNDTAPTSNDTISDESVDADAANDTAEPAAVTPDEPTTAATSPAPGTYTTYSDTAFTSDLSEHRIVFFHATWCPTCKAADQAIAAAQADIPADVTIFKADYDTETDLRAQYGITLQHSFALIDQTGALVKTWNGSRNVEEIISQL